MPRSEALARLSPDVAVITECERPPLEDGPRARWFGKDTHPLGVAVLVSERYSIHPYQADASVPPFVIPMRIEGPESFNLLAVWTWEAPTYGHTLLKGLKAYRDLLADERGLVAGDFNSNAIWDKDNPEASHSMAVEFLTGCGLVSAYHDHFGEAHGSESTQRATHYHGWREDRPFHIDYCFVPKSWTPRIEHVTVGSFAEYRRLSDHRPVSVQLSAVQPSRAAAT
jgi:hypothetical protein